MTAPSRLHPTIAAALAPFAPPPALPRDLRRRAQRLADEYHHGWLASRDERYWHLSGEALAIEDEAGTVLAEMSLLLTGTDWALACALEHEDADWSTCEAAVCLADAEPWTAAWLARAREFAAEGL